jgi:hypothetical protein
MILVLPFLIASICISVACLILTTAFKIQGIQSDFAVVSGTVSFIVTILLSLLTFLKKCSKCEARGYFKLLSKTLASETRLGTKWVQTGDSGYNVSLISKVYDYRYFCECCGHEWHDTKTEKKQERIY